MTCRTGLLCFCFQPYSRHRAFSSSSVHPILAGISLLHRSFQRSVCPTGVRDWRVLRTPFLEHAFTVLSVFVPREAAEDGGVLFST